MNIIKLKDVSKFYYNKGIISSGFSKLNVEFSLGEFVVVTGESGSGKSTLLNVISGLDSYEEGEMYINGKETSHYSERDFEDYRKKYISNIFQNFNLINSYTVYQNVELVLLINGYKKHEIKSQVLELIKQVDLTKYRNTKVSKLSGGQKQRVAIARALAKNTPIIIADEPTGNLDSRAAESVIRILSEIAKDKLVIIVTHNYEQVEKYATRKVTMHDGKIIEDKVISNEYIEGNITYPRFGNITIMNKIRLGIRNAFNIIPKFLLIFLVYFFIVSALTAEHSSFAKNKYEDSLSGQNQYFYNTSDTRIIVKKSDNSSFSDTDINNIEKLDNVDYVIKNDLLEDNEINLTDNDMLYLYGIVYNNNLITSVDVGSLPTNENEVVIEGNKDDYYIGNGEELIGKTVYYTNYMNGYLEQNIALKIVGIKYNSGVNSYDYRFYLNGKYLDSLGNDVFLNHCTFSTILNKNTVESANYIPLDSVPSGYVYISSDYSYLCGTYGNCKNKVLNLTLNNIYYTSSIDLKVQKTYTKDNFKSITGLTDYDTYNGSIFINTNDYYSLISDDSYQISVFVDNYKDIDKTVSKLNDLDFKTLKISDTLYNYNEGYSEVMNIINLIVTTVLIIVIFFISYFIIKIILKSRNIYYSTLRILGSNKKVAKQLLEIELFSISNLAFIILMVLIYLINKNIIILSSVKDLLSFMNLSDYILIYVLLTLMTYFIAIKFAKQLFKKSAMKTYNEEV